MLVKTLARPAPTQSLTNHLGPPVIVHQKKVMIMAAFTVRLPDDTTNRLDRLAEKLDRSRSSVAAQAIEDFVAREEWQLAEIEAGLAEADSGEFARGRDVAAVVGKYVRSARQS